MKSTIINAAGLISRLLLMLLLVLGLNGPLSAQDEQVSEIKPVKKTFNSIWLIDNQSVMVPAKGTFEMDIQHRFGTWKDGYDDFFGLYASSNIRLGFLYSPINRLNVGFGFAKIDLTWDGSLKYAILEQKKGGGSPISLTYFVNTAIDTRPKDNFVHASDRYSFFHQLIIARKFTDNFSLQIAPCFSHFNSVNGTIDSDGQKEVIKNDEFAISIGGRYKITNVTAIIVNYDQPITKQPVNNPYANISFGLEFSTSSHTFQVFAGNYYNIIPQLNSMYNKNDFKNGEFLIGFNITRLWNF